MSITISNCYEICHAPTNQSSAKMLYSFPKQQRFIRRRQILCDKFYDLKGTASNRSASFGYGTKYDFTKEAPHSPPANTYNLKDEFNSDHLKKGFSFGEGRQEMVATGPLMQTIHNKNPGPGTYESLRKNNVISYSLYGKNPYQNKQQMKIPGPGEYPVAFCINEKGKYFLSKHKNSSVRDFSKIMGRCKTSESKIPGPGSYELENVNLSPKGKYCLSNLQNCLTRKFGTSKRDQISLNKTTPGPGNYKLPSEFGHYIAKNAFKKSAAGAQFNFKENRDNKQNQVNTHTKQ